MQELIVGKAFPTEATLVRPCRVEVPSRARSVEGGDLGAGDDPVEDRFGDDRVSERLALIGRIELKGRQRQAPPFRAARMLISSAAVCGATEVVRKSSRTSRSKLCGSVWKSSRRCEVGSSTASQLAR